jgi:SAM-dependent methyltransferase
MRSAGSHPGRLRRIGRWIRERGVAWTGLTMLHRLMVRLHAPLGTVRAVERMLVRIEKRRFIVGPGTAGATSQTIEENRFIWDRWDWTRYGEEWTEQVRGFRGEDPEDWRQRLIRETIAKYAPEGGTVVEIGPGAGRWSGDLLQRADDLILVDISPVCLDLCRSRFADRSNVRYVLTDGRSLPSVEKDTVDFIWSYDTFVHINPSHTDAYLGEFARVLKEGAYASIHHPGDYAEKRRPGFRSHVDGRFFGHLARKHGLELVAQDDSLAHMPGDLVSVIRKGSGGRSR